MERIIIESALKLEVLNNKTRYALGNYIDALDEVSSALFDVIWAQRGLPEDTTTMYEHGHPKYFCRDYIDNIFYDWLLSKEFKNLEQITDKEIDKAISLFDEGMNLYRKEKEAM
jgi:hypothetical protein